MMVINGGYIVGHIHLLDPNMVSKNPAIESIPMVNLYPMAFVIEFIDRQTFPCKTVTRM